MEENTGVRCHCTYAWSNCPGSQEQMVKDLQERKTEMIQYCLRLLFENVQMIVPVRDLMSPFLHSQMKGVGLGRNL